MLATNRSPPPAPRLTPNQVVSCWDVVYMRRIEDPYPMRATFRLGAAAAAHEHHRAGGGGARSTPTGDVGLAVRLAPPTPTKSGLPAIQMLPRWTSKAQIPVEEKKA